MSRGVYFNRVIDGTEMIKVFVFADHVQYVQYVDEDQTCLVFDDSSIVVQGNMDTTVTKLEWAK